MRDFKNIHFQIDKPQTTSVRARFIRDPKLDHCHQQDKNEPESPTKQSIRRLADNQEKIEEIGQLADVENHETK